MAEISLKTKTYGNFDDEKVRKTAQASWSFHSIIKIILLPYKNYNANTLSLESSLTPTVSIRRQSKTPESVLTFITLPTSHILLALTLSGCLITCSIVCDSLHEAVTG